MSTKKEPRKSVAKDKWVATKRRYVCYIDIMGFKDMIATKKNADIYKMMKKIVGYQRLNASVEWNKKTDLIKTTTYSDNVIIYSRNDSRDSLNAITCTIAGLSQDLLSEGIPHKGALSLGTMTCDTKESIFFGQPLIDSYLLQEELYFYGIIVHGSAQKGIQIHNLTSFLETYNCPLKKGQSNHLTINPIYLGSKRFTDRNKELFKSVDNMKIYTSGHLRVYIDSTIDYLKTIEARIKKRLNE